MRTCAGLDQASYLLQVPNQESAVRDRQRSRNASGRQRLAPLFLATTKEDVTTKKRYVRSPQASVRRASSLLDQRPIVAYSHRPQSPHQFLLTSRERVQRPPLDRRVVRGVAPVEQVVGKNVGLRRQYGHSGSRCRSARPKARPSDLHRSKGVRRAGRPVIASYSSLPETALRQQDRPERRAISTKLSINPVLPGQGEIPNCTLRGVRPE